MKIKKRNIDPLPESFASEKEAGEFWDTHSTADYKTSLKPADITVDIKRRHFEIEVDRQTFIALHAYAKKIKKPVKNLASSILKDKLASMSR